MKICYLAGANSIHSYRWIKYFADSGHDVSWISLVDSIFDPIEGVKFFKIHNARTIFSLAHSAIQVRAIVRNVRPEILHVHSVGTYGFLGLWSGAPKLIATPWGSDIIFGSESLIKRPFIRAVLQRSAVVTCDALHIRDRAVDLGVPSSRVRVINFGIDTERFSPQGVDLSIREKYEVGRGPAVISLRNFESVYDVETLIRAAPIVARTFPDVKFLLVGKGALERALRSLVDELGASAYVRFIGFVANQTLPQTLSSADLYVSTSLSDAGIAASTAEAMACGLPVVVTNSGENSAWIEDGINGMLVPVKNPVALAEKLVRVLGDGLLRSKLGAAGRLTIKQRNDFYVEMGKMLAIYKDVAR